MRVVAEPEQRVRVDRDRIAQGDAPQVPVLTALWGLLASLTSLRAAIATAGLLILATPLLLPAALTRRRPAAARPRPG